MSNSGRDRWTWISKDFTTQERKLKHEQRNEVILTHFDYPFLSVHPFRELSQLSPI